MPWITEQKIFIVEAYFRQKSIHTAQMQFKERCGCREFPVHSMIYKWVNKFRTHRTVHNLNRKDANRQSHSGRPKSSRTPHNAAAVRDSVVHSPSKSVRRRSQILDSTWSTERSRQGPPVDPAVWCYPPLLKRIIGMATAAFPWPSDQPQVWPAVVAAFIGLEPPRFYLWGYLKDMVYGNNPQTIPDLKAAITAAIRLIPREECGRVIENLPAGSKCACSAGELIWGTFFERQWKKEFL